jgi:hypothetical protein
VAIRTDRPWAPESVDGYFYAHFSKVEKIQEEQKLVTRNEIREQEKDLQNLDVKRGKTLVAISMGKKTSSIMDMNNKRLLLKTAVSTQLPAKKA